MTTITKERLLKIQQWRETYGADSNVMLPAEEAEELARIALASLTAEPVAWTDEEELRDLRKVGFCEMFSVEPISKDADMLRVIPLYRHAQPAPERKQIRREHAEWSDATFGDVGPVGPLKHLSKEALESAAEPGDLSEWADMQFLLWDAQRRAGISDGEITAAMEEKLKVNMARQWPEPKDGEPRLHIKEQPAPIVPPAIEPDYKVIKSILPTANPDEYACCIAADMWNACRAAMLQGGQPVSNRDELQVIGWLRSDYNSDDKRDPNAPLFMLGSNDPSDAWGVKYIPLSGNSPVIPGGWVMVPKKLTAENGAKSLLSGEFLETTFISCPECFTDEECESCDGSGRIKIEVPVSWTTIKAIWNKGVEHFRSSTATGDN
ncbi:DUF550 domain-containing protein [Salmonella enterica]|uniref:DUF550 domain-containing protein n=2 Tax=Salmonella enterica TaxID=28901 RepID=UPI0003BD8F64|nr:DUF550 domain-containing protein [Salmonella enterica]ELN2941136.1 DUF550 domain-containing protein [Salmonella enterica]ESH53070.1 hypothetical protein SEEB8392_00830 [Salmonella enterica subsp. enterica serovar Berta str. ATCC 8392]KJV11313.1 hypothetical protein VI32_22470 [Salmonella enterica subsp. enterica serovar Berta]KJV23451.1 hypothetical protein VF01_05315 [Salmonella enterica subsp. enterica serovar Berta str. ATCC 8392]